MLKKESVADITVPWNERDQILRERVMSAFNNRRKTCLVDQREDKESVSKAERQAEELGRLHGNRKVILGDPDPEPPSTVSVDNPHEYKIVLQQAFSLIFPPNEARVVADETLKHELRHSAPALGQPGLNVKYEVDFAEDQNTGKIVIVAQVSLTGSTRIGVIKRVMRAAKDTGDESLTDSIFNQRLNRQRGK